MTAKLLKPIVAVLKDVPKSKVTLPPGATVEFVPASATVGIVDLLWAGTHYSAYLEDLLDACDINDVGRSAW